MSGQDNAEKSRAVADEPKQNEAGDGWVAGAWSAEGWVSVTSVRASSEPDETDGTSRPDGDSTAETDRGADRAAAVDAVATDEAGTTAEAAGGPADHTPERPSKAADAGDTADTTGRAAADAVGDTAGSTAAAVETSGSTPAESAVGSGSPAAVASEPERDTEPSRPAAQSRPRPRPDAATAAELTEDAIVRFRGDRPRQGWRGVLYTATGGLINPGIGPIERARQEQLRRIRRPLPGSHQIAVSSIKGGVGKTSVAACLGLVLAENRGDRVIALDANPDAGTLADRLTSEVSVTVRHLLANIEATHSLTDVARYTSLAGRLQVLASEQDPAMSEAFSREEYERVCEVLTRFYNIIITDSGTGLVHSAMEGTLALADSLVVVGAPTVDGASRASKTLDWLIAHGHAAQVAGAVVVLSCDRVSQEVDRGRVREHFEARCRAVVEVPHDPHLATGGRIELARLKPATHDAFLTLAAHLADEFGGGHRAAGASSNPVPSYT
ncbi:AAA family ATPase [Pseudonocardia sp. H11422]|uniref:AAA family ATPase n=1 Tax=Pseudonocardia sp. H11422 TaxID=2835866 RepID=UPI0027E277CF|nr:AAA family ATPase [Pseudonocardia sp. H11422]